MKKYLFCFGTRPEAVKMAPIIKRLESQGVRSYVCITGQHKEMITPFLNFFDIKVDFNLEIMKPNQTLSSITASILEKIEVVLDELNPNAIIVQGDTTTTFTCALAAFYKKIDVYHVEAGLRTGDINTPFPEELNRRLVSVFAKKHFAPTRESLKNLQKEGINQNVYETGNTSVDALRIAIERIETSNIEFELSNKYKNVDFNKKLILVTAHRRENHGEPMLEICRAIEHISTNHDVQIVFPVHKNPNVINVIHDKLSNLSNVVLLEPLEYTDFIWFMSKSHIILTDSGGVQEEGPYLKKPILVMRESTERPEGVTAGCSLLVGTNFSKITNCVNRLMLDVDFYNTFKNATNPYGDGYAADKIIELL